MKQKITHPHQSVTVPFLECPAFQDREEATDFDRITFASHPNCRQYLRRLSPFELPPEQIKKVCPSGTHTFMLVVQVFPGMRLSAILVYPSQKSPAAISAELENDVKAIEMILKMRKGTYANN